MNTQPLTILLIEDDDVDAMAFQRHVNRASVPTEILRAVDGADGLTKLRELNARIESPLLVILDLNMPRMNGLEFLSVMRQDPELRHHVVFVLTTSDAPSDLIDSYNKNIAAYVMKSRVGDKFQNLVSLIDSYYTTVEFPSSKFLVAQNTKQ